MASKTAGKEWIRDWILDRMKWSDVILDVGACDGVWADLLRDKLRRSQLVAVEAFRPNAEALWEKYGTVCCIRIQDFKYPRGFYKLAIFGDVIEHMSVEDAQAVLEYAADRCEDIVVAVPFLYKQGELYGNPFEVHIQDDLTPELMAERYPMLELLLQAEPGYAYYHLKGREK